MTHPLCFDSASLVENLRVTVKNKARRQSGKKFNTHTSNGGRHIKCVRPRQDKIKRHLKEIRLGVRMFGVKGTIMSCSCWARSDRHSTCAFINEALCAYLSRPSAYNVTHCRTTPFLRLWGEISALALFNKSWQHTAAEKQNKSCTLASARPKMKRDQNGLEH